MTAILRTYQNEKQYVDAWIEVDDHHDFAGGPYQETVHQTIGSNQAILPITQAQTTPWGVMAGAVTTILDRGEVKDDETWYSAHIAAARMASLTYSILSALLKRQDDPELALLLAHGELDPWKEHILREMEK